jgi:hypothetical protein|tara:strand:+ start:48 stop:440 length:393 start_codon:yes stop_codon:yes gene_type:complete
MIKYEMIKGHTCPIVVCDICGKEITHGRLGMIFFTTEWFKEEFLKGRPTVEFITIHKGDCDILAKKKYGDNGFDEISQFIVYLCHNLKLEPDSLESYTTTEEELEDIRQQWRKQNTRPVVDKSFRQGGGE